MAEIAKRFFHNLFSTSETGDMEHILSGVDRCISNELNAILTARYTIDKIYAALKRMRPTKAPRIDGFSTLFF